MSALRMSSFSGQQLAQVDNPDPFAPPVWRDLNPNARFWFSADRRASWLHGIDASRR